jgi:SSS family solute:Na+ symporter
MGFVASLTAAASYVVVSLCTPDPKIDMDRLLHRGAYRVQTPNGTDHPVAPPVGWKAVLPGPEFTGGDRLIYWLKVGWVLFFFVTFLGICLWQVFQPWPDEWWANWWFFNLVFTGVTGTLATVWFLVGGLRDLKALFIRLGNTRRDAADDGSVPRDEHLGKLSR